MNTKDIVPVLHEVKFAGDTVEVLERDGEHYVTMKPLCKRMGLDWQGQHQLIQRDPVLSQVICMIQMTSVGKDGKTYRVDMSCLPLTYLNGWLFKIDISRYADDRRETLIRYQKECYQALFDHFFGNAGHARAGMAEGREETMISTRITNDVKAALERFAAEDGITVSSVCEQAFCMYIRHRTGVTSESTPELLTEFFSNLERVIYGRNMHPRRKITTLK